MSRTTTFKPDMILKVGYDFFTTKGMKELTARTLSKAGKFSSQPIYTAFGSLEYLKAKIINYTITQFDLQLIRAKPNTLTELELFLIKYLASNHGILTTMVSEPK